MDQAEQLRNIIKASSQPQRPLARVITVTSGKGGVGKSNTAINLAIQFRKMDQRVVILDADFGLANIEIMFGAVPKHKATVKAMGLTKMHKTVEMPDNAATRGMIQQVQHLVKVEEA